MSDQKEITRLSDGVKEILARLTERQKAILIALVKLFVRSAQPVSSGQLAQIFDVSSATIRNELAFLEDLAFLSKDHQASGRVPTDLAYRFFVDEIRAELKPDQDEQARAERALLGLQRELRLLMEGALRHLTKESGQASWVTVPILPDLRIRSVDFIPTADRSFLILIVTTKGNTRHRMATLDERIDASWLSYLKEQLNNYIGGRLITDVDGDEIGRIFAEVRRLPRKLIEHVTGFLDELGQGSERIYISDSRPLLAQPEFRDVTLMNAVLDVLNDHSLFNTYVRDIFGEDDLRVVIGQENVETKLTACSLVSARYKLSGAVGGTVGVIGPTRQTYDLNIPLVAVVADCLAELLRDTPFSL
ncbi:heat-inducible transcription repressor HrcA [bacterium]|nr:heat-inducible transcription repressor HrcA [bacterium]